MRIKKVETLTGITSKNIRFYEKEGLLAPKRNRENQYRSYSKEDVVSLNKIKLLRKLDVSIVDIRELMAGEQHLGTRIAHHINTLEEKKNELERAIAICMQITKEDVSLDSLDIDYYLNEIEAAEKAGAKFTDIARDFVNKVKEKLPPKAKYWFEPCEPILNGIEFEIELRKYARNAGRELEMIRRGMIPIIQLDGLLYTCYLQPPRPAIFAARGNIGWFKYVYIYEGDDAIL